MYYNILCSINNICIELYNIYYTVVLISAAQAFTEPESPSTYAYTVRAVALSIVLYYSTAFLTAHGAVFPILALFIFIILMCSKRQNKNNIIEAEARRQGGEGDRQEYIITRFHLLYVGGILIKEQITS